MLSTDWQPEERPAIAGAEPSAGDARNDAVIEPAAGTPISRRLFAAVDRIGQEPSAAPDIENAHSGPGERATLWSYAGEEGPGRWGDLDPDFALCATGRSQSPVDLGRAIDGAHEDLRFGYQPTELAIANNGHTIQVDYRREAGSRSTICATSCCSCTFMRRASTGSTGGRHRWRCISCIRTGMASLPWWA